MLRRRLTQIAERLPDVRLLALIDRDGLPVESVRFDGSVDADTLAAELTAVARDIVSGHEESGLGTLRQISVSVERQLIMLSFLTLDYCLLLVADDQAGPGRARFELRRARQMLVDDLS